jgi:hypothetical protein
LADELLGINTVTTGTVIPSGEEIPEHLRKEQNRQDEVRGWAVM